MRELAPFLALISLIALLAGCSGGTPADPPTPHDPTSSVGLDLAIASDKPAYQTGERPKFTVTLTNRGSEPVRLVAPGDGSSSAWRTPIIGWSIIDMAELAQSHPKEPRPYGGGRCGNINTLKPDEIFVVQPGVAHKIAQGCGPIRFPKKPGRYRVVFYYTNDPGLTWGGVPLGTHDPAAMAAVKQSSPCALTSNELVITIAK